MFIVFNKSKINSYLISLGTVIILFSLGFMISTNNDAIETSASLRELPIYNVEIEEKKLAFTMNCAWS